MSLFKKALGAFVEFEEKEKRHRLVEAPVGAEAEPQPVVLPDAPADLTADPDVQRVEQAIALLGSLPLAEIPVEKARELIVRTLQFAGMNPEALIGSFERAQGLLQAQVRSEQELIASRRRVNEERLTLLQAAIAEEKEQCQAEVAARTGRIERATGSLGEIEKAMAFFAAKE